MARGGAMGRGTAPHAGRWRVRFPMGVIGIFHWHYGTGVDSASNRNK